MLEGLPPDASAHLLSYLYPYEMFHFALVSKRGREMCNNDELWRIKFRTRWNCPPDPEHVVRAGGEGDGSEEGTSGGGSGETRTFWRRCYVAAHRNPHDLWVRHWNCAYPEDVTTCPGRTAVPDVRFEGGEGGCPGRMHHLQNGGQRNAAIEDACQELARTLLDATGMRACPTCRYHPMLHPEGCDDVLGAMECEMKFARQRARDEAQLSGRGGAPESDPVRCTEVAAAAHALLANAAEGARADGRDSSPARAVHCSTRHSMAKWCRNVNGAGLLERCRESLLQGSAGKDHSESSARDKAKFAFECASTHERRIDAEQYRSSGVQFLSDALFFNIHPARDHNRTSSPALRSRLAGKEPSPERHAANSPMDELERDVRAVSQLGPGFETSHHSWHVVRLTNPDFVLPIAFRTYLQSDNFTIYPSEGYLRPGETVHLVLGVRAKGALVHDAFERFDVEKGDAEESAGEHLPLVPFAIRYIFAPPVGCAPHEYAARPDGAARSLFAPAHLQQHEAVSLPAVVAHLWDNVTAEADVRTIFLSAHVHSSFGLEELQHAALMPFDVSVERGHASAPHSRPLTAVMPQLQQKDPRLFALLLNLDEEVEDSDRGDAYRTEKRCAFCRRDWGPQSEVLGRSFLLRRLECTRQKALRLEQRDDFERTLSAIPSLLEETLSEGDVSVARVNRVSQLLFSLHTDYLLQRRADRLVAKEERRLCSAYESYIDETYADLQSLLPESSDSTAGRGDGWRFPWNESKDESTNIWRENGGAAPQNAKGGDGFIDRQDDPNHDAEPSMHTDMFQDDPVKGLVMAWNMISNPEALVGHGVFDRVKAPGGVIRCPSHPIDAFFRAASPERDREQLIRDAKALLQQVSLIAKPREKGSRKGRHRWAYFKRINFEMNEQDPDGLALVTIGSGVQLNCQTSMAHYLSNVPLPGQGAFSLCSPKWNGDGHAFDNSILTLYTTVQPYSHLLFPARLQICGNDEQGSGENQLRDAQGQRNQQQGGGGQGHNPLELNIVWLIARHLGWVVDDEEHRGSLLVDRRLLIATQWLSNTLLVWSLLASLLSRHFELITSSPVDVRVGFWQDVYMHIPVRTSIDVAGKRIGTSRFWTNQECGVAAVIVFVLYWILGRLYERQIGRSYERELTEASPYPTQSNHGSGVVGRIVHQICRRLQWWWESTCPLFVQQRLFMSSRSKQSRQDVMNQVVHLRSTNEGSTSVFSAVDGRGRMHTGIVSRESLGVGGHLLALAFFFLSFSACSPHFVVNSLTCFCCGISYGMSLSLESMEIVRRTTSTGVLSMVKPRRLNTLVVGFVTIGQLVGSSGGVVFLAEFVVTAISLLLGGAAAVTSRALESWITFFCLSSTCFWGFVSARLGLLDGMRNKRRGIPSLLLCASLCTAVTMWALVLTHVDWYSLSPGSIMIAQLREMVSDIRRRRG
ncbi:hypothetical protein ACHAXT_005169 [Thalassiosira profunda]